MGKLALPPLERKRSTSQRFDKPSISLREDSLEKASAHGKNLSRELGVSEACARILAARGLHDFEEAKRFLNPTLRDHLPDPATMKNLNAAVDLILDAITEKKRIAVFSDFDVDGLTSGAQLVLYLSSLGGNILPYVPNRFSEGYGLSPIAVERLAEAGIEFLITVDCGISSIDELALAKKRGMKSVVLDHHLPGSELPDADAVVDPAQGGCPFEDSKLAAAGIVWLTLILLRRKARERGIVKENGALDPKDFLDLAALGTICDMVPLHGVNRLIASRGVEVLKRGKRIGVAALKEAAGVDSVRRFGSGHVSFGLGPRINAAGRLGDANEIITLLTTGDSKKAKRVAQSIDRLNDQRREIEARVRDSCIEELSSSEDLLAQPAIAVFGEDYHLGVIGIAAQRLVEEYYRPAAVMGPGELRIGKNVERVIKGSVRGISGFHVADVLKSLGDILLAHGGHAQAGGFTVAEENLGEFQRRFIAAADGVLTEELLQRRVQADIRIRLSEVDHDLAVELLKLAPFGVGNPSPLIVSEGVRVDAVSVIKDKHLRVRLADSKCSRNGVAWSMNGHPLLRKDEIVNAAYQIELNTYNGISSVQLNIKEIWAP